MIINKEKFKLSIAELLMVILSVLFMIGIRTWFAVCPVMSETIMSCHWAGEVLKALSILLAAVSVIHIICPDWRLKIGIDIPMFCICILTAFIPGGLINLCMMEEMACRSQTKLWTIIISIALIIVILADIIICASAVSKEKHGRKALS